MWKSLKIPIASKIQSQSTAAGAAAAGLLAAVHTLSEGWSAAIRGLLPPEPQLSLLPNVHNPGVLLSLTTSLGGARLGWHSPISMV